MPTSVRRRRQGVPRPSSASPSRSKASTRRPSLGARPMHPPRNLVAGSRPRARRWACLWHRPPGCDAIDLTVVVVFYNMRREAARTLRSPFARATNRVSRTSPTRSSRSRTARSRPEARRGVRPELRPRVPLRRHGRGGSAVALARAERGNQGRSRQQLRADDRRGAHVLTPSVVELGLKGLRDVRDRPSSRHSSGTCGPGQQGDAMSDGYDQAYEDRLFGPHRLAGCRAIDSSRSATSSAGATGSTACGRATACSCPRAQLEQVGGFDENFSMPGGGFANLDPLRTAGRRHRTSPW